MSTIHPNDIPKVPANKNGYTRFLLEKIDAKDAQITHLVTQLRYEKSDRWFAWTLSACLLVIVVCMWWQWPQVQS